MCRSQLSDRMEKRMKKILCLSIALIMAMAIFAGCTSQTTESTVESETQEQTSSQEQDVVEEEATEEAEEVTAEPVDASAVALKGPTAMGMLKFMNDNENGLITSNNYTFSIETAIDVVTAQLIQGEVDFAAVPSNVASAIYNNSEGKVQVIAINTLGVLYIAESGEAIQSIEDLKGKTIYASGKGATPEYALNQILAANGLTDEVTIEWKTEQTEVVQALSADPNAIAMLPQPFVTTAQAQNESIRIALDLTEVWNESEIEGSLITGVVVVNKEFADANPAAVEDFMANYEESVNYINDNIEEGAALVGQYEIVPEAVALQAIPQCNITFIKGDEMKEMLSGYLNVLFTQNPQSVGGVMPDDVFYYGAQ